MIALERGTRPLAIVLEAARECGCEIRIPATVLARAWRGGPRAATLERLIASSSVDSLDERRAMEVGSRLGARGGLDVADCHVVCCALERQAVVATSDAEDIRALLGPGEKVALIAV